jgi:hypothetical protein
MSIVGACRSGVESSTVIGACRFGVQALPPAEAAAATERFVLSATARGSAYSALQVRLRTQNNTAQSECNDANARQRRARGPLHSGVGCTGMRKHNPGHSHRRGRPCGATYDMPHGMAYITYRPIQHGCGSLQVRRMAMMVCLVDDSRVHRIVSAVRA